MLEYIILGTLLNSELTGYDIRKYIEEGIGMFYRASFGSIYPLLGKLTNQGDVICSNFQEGKRNKKKYLITEQGKTVFINWLREENESNSSMEAFMAKVFFFDKLPREVATRNILIYEKKLIDYKERLLTQRKKYIICDQNDQFYFKLSTLYFGICKLQSMIDWCEVLRNEQDLETLVKM